MNNSPLNQIEISGDTPLRGSVKVQSSPNLTQFLLSLNAITGKTPKLIGNFTSQVVLDFCTKISSFGFEVLNTGDTLELLNYKNTNSNVFFSGSDFTSSLILSILLSKKGSIEVINNKDLVSFYKYLGLEIVEGEGKFTVNNKIAEEAKSSITFHTLNDQYYYIAILALLLNHKEFSISSVDLTYEINLLIEHLKEVGIVKDVIYGNFITVHFDFTNIEKLKLEKARVPGDPTEFIFFCSAAIATGGEIEINGLDPKLFASTLKLYSSLGIGFESVNENTFKIWWGRGNLLENVDITDQSPYLDFTKLCLIPLISQNNKKAPLPISVSIKTDDYKSLLQEMNMLGLDLQIFHGSVVCEETVKIRSGKVTFEEYKESDNYIRLLLTLSGANMSIKDYNNLVYYNHNLLNKLENLGAKIDYGITN